jgi:hypothetical protein
VGRQAVRLMVYAVRGELPQRLRELRSARAVLIWLGLFEQFLGVS